jgi:hypothetical protein
MRRLGRWTRAAWGAARPPRASRRVPQRPAAAALGFRDDVSASVARRMPTPPAVPRPGLGPIRGFAADASPGSDSSPGRSDSSPGSARSASGASAPGSLAKRRKRLVERMHRAKTRATLATLAAFVRAHARELDAIAVAAAVRLATKIAARDRARGERASSAFPDVLAWMLPGASSVPPSPLAPSADAAVGVESDHDRAFLSSTLPSLVRLRASASNPPPSAAEAVALLYAVGQMASGNKMPERASLCATSDWRAALAAAARAAALASGDMRPAEASRALWALSWACDAAPPGTVAARDAAAVGRAAARRAARMDAAATAHCVAASERLGSEWLDEPTRAMVAAVAIARREGRLMTPPSQTRRGQKGPGRMAKKMSDETSDALSTSSGSGPKKKNYSHRRRKKTERSERRERGSEERGSEEGGEGAEGEGGGVGPGGS